MKLDRTGIKVFLDDSSSIDTRELIPIFHRWIQKQAIENHLLVDVHDYSHVPKGPGILLYGHQGSFNLDLGQNRPGLLYRRNRRCDASDPDQLSSTMRPLLQGLRLLQSDSLAGGILRFKTDEFRFTVYDRLHAPNNEETFRRFQPVLSRFLKQKLDRHRFNIEHLSDLRELFSVDVKFDASLDTDKLLHHLEDDTIN